jgi:hypothetical protein
VVHWACFTLWGPYTQLLWMTELQSAAFALTRLWFHQIIQRCILKLSAGRQCRIPNLSCYSLSTWWNRSYHIPVCNYKSLKGTWERVEQRGDEHRRSEHCIHKWAGNLLESCGKRTIWVFIWICCKEGSCGKRSVNRFASDHLKMCGFSWTITCDV